jgi:hypothetical protein
VPKALACRENFRLPWPRFFQDNIDWIAATLPQTIPAKARRGKATHILATLQGATTVAGSLKSHKVFDDAVRDLHA